MYKKNKTYELEVHFGLLVLVIIMLSLNIFSNFVIYSGRNILVDDIEGELYKSSLAISRHLQNNQMTSVSDSDKRLFLKKYNLDDLFFIQSYQKDFSKNENIQNLQQSMTKIPPEQMPNIIKTIVSADYYELTRGVESHYAFAAPLIIGKSNNILVLSKNLPKLAYLDDSSNTLKLISMIAFFAIALIYILLYRFILPPFRLLKEKAKSAGRNIPKEDYEVDSVLNEYQIIIKELKEKERELVKLHQGETLRADSLEQFNEYLLGSMNAGIITIDKDGKVLTFNNAAEKIFQTDSFEYLNKSYTSLPFLSKKLLAKIDRTLHKNIFHAYEEYSFTNIDLKAGITISPVCDNETHQIGASILINDISEIKSLQNELEKNRQMSALGEMSAGLAHQLRNSLGAIVGYNQLVKKRLTQNNLDTHTVDSMATELNESEHLIKRFLNFTKPFDFSPENENIADFIESIIETLSVRDDFEKISLQFDNQLAKNYETDIDTLLLKQAITNLIENSKNAYDDADGSIHVKVVNVENETCQISITDNGCGIDNDNLEKIFTPFYSTNPSGTGLGLPLAQKIIALHNGHLIVESEIGKGTTFKIILPLSTSSAQIMPKILL